MYRKYTSPFLNLRTCQANIQLRAKTGTYFGHDPYLSPYMTEHIKRFGEYILDLIKKPENLRQIRDRVVFDLANASTAHVSWLAPYNVFYSPCIEIILIGGKGPFYLC